MWFHSYSIDILYSIVIHYIIWFQISIFEASGQGVSCSASPLATPRCSSSRTLLPSRTPHRSPSPSTAWHNGDALWIWMDVIWVSSTCVKYLEKIVIQFQKMCFNGMFVFLFYLFWILDCFRALFGRHGIKLDTVLSWHCMVSIGEKLREIWHVR